MSAPFIHITTRRVTPEGRGELYQPLQRLDSGFASTDGEEEVAGR